MNAEQNEEMLTLSAEAQNEPVMNVPEENESGENGLEKENRELSERVGELSERVGELEAELMRERIKVLLLISGILPDRLEDGAAMAYGLCLAGKSPETAADEIIEAYPHLKAVRREIPRFSAESKGSGDGFSAIRKIFSMK